MSDTEASKTGGARLEVRVTQSQPIRLRAVFECNAGEVLALVGPSGGGKTTILRAIAGLYRPRSGLIRCGEAIWLDTETNLNLSPQARRVGFVFQDYALFPHLSVADNIAAALRGGGEQTRSARVSELLEQVNLAGLGERRPHMLSGGQQQRVAIARALARDPDVLLLDEPFSAVDQVTRRKLREELADLRRALSIPVVLVTHDLEEAGMLADRMCILHRGETLQTGSPFEVMRQPQSAAVARLVDLTNLFEARVTQHEPECKKTYLNWRGQRLEARYQPDFALGEVVYWVIPSAAILLHRRDRPSRGERENPIDGTIVSFVPLGESANVTMSLRDAPQTRLTFSVPTHVAGRNRVGEGGAVRVSLLSDAITLMPMEGD